MRIKYDNCVLFQTIHDAEKSEFGKRGKELAEGIGKTATKAAESVTKGGEQIAQSQVFKSVATVSISYSNGQYVKQFLTLQIFV